VRPESFDGCLKRPTESDAVWLGMMNATNALRNGCERSFARAPDFAQGQRFNVAFAI
jgi:hypothetical protein